MKPVSLNLQRTGNGFRAASQNIIGGAGVKTGIVGAVKSWVYSSSPKSCDKASYDE